MTVAWSVNHRRNGFSFRPGDGSEYVMTLRGFGGALGC